MWVCPVTLNKAVGAPLAALFVNWREVDAKYQVKRLRFEK
jgi:hypothetical protein